MISGNPFREWTMTINEYNNILAILRSCVLTLSTLIVIISCSILIENTQKSDAHLKIVGVVTIIYRFRAQLPTAVGARNVWRKINNMEGSTRK